MSAFRRLPGQTAQGGAISTGIGTLGGSFETLDTRFIDTLPVAVYVCDADGYLIRVNPRAVQIWGTEPSPVARYLGSRSLEHRDGTPIAPGDSPMAHVLRTGDILQDVDYVELRTDDSKVLVRATIVPLRNADDDIIGAINTFQDITSQERAATDRARLAAIIDSSDDAIVSKTLQGVITSWNAGAERVFGYTAEEAIGQHISILIPHDRLPEEDEVLARLRRGERVDHFETIRRVKNGELINISLTVSPIRDGNGVIVGASKVARDITERSRAAAAIAASRQRYLRIFETAGVSMWEQDFSAVRHALGELRAQGVSDIESHLEGRPELSQQLLDCVRTVDVNQATVQMFHAADKQAVLRSMDAIRSDESRQIYRRVLTAFARGDTRFDAETTLQTVNGRRVDALVNITFPSPGESFQSVLVSLTDITLRKQVEEALRSSETALKQEIHIRETLARVGASLAAELDPDRLVQAVTDAATSVTTAEFGALFYNVVDESGEAYQLYALSGASRAFFESFPNPRATALFGPTFRGEGIVRLDDVRGDPRFGKNPPYNGLPSGHLDVRSYLAVPVVSRTGEVLGGLFFGHSRPGVFVAQHEQLAAGIATWAALALDNARLYRHAQEANRSKDEFLATLSHELRTPLNAVLGWSHLLQTSALPEETQRRALEAIERNAKAQAQLVDDLLDVSRIVSGRLQMKSADVDLGAVVQGALDTVRPAIAAKGLELEVEDPPPAVVIGDADRLRQIFWNLFTNAVKFTPRDGKISVHFQMHDQTVAVSVRDTGQGIHSSFLPHVFERFRQADSTVSRRHGGLGLGLAIVRHLAEAHGGTVVASSPGEGQGSTFTVRLPTHPAHRPQAAPTVRRPTSSELSGVRALVVDDEPDVRELVGVMLESHGASVTLAASAGEALDRLLRQRFDVLLADLGMPDQDGYALITAVRALPTRASATLPAIAVTAYAGLSERTRSVSAGYGWHVTKPIDADQLISVVATAVRHSQTSR